MAKRFRSELWNPVNDLARMFESGIMSDFSIVCTKKDSVADPQIRETKGLFVITNPKAEEDGETGENEENQENGENEEDRVVDVEGEDNEDEIVISEGVDEDGYEKFGTSTASPEHLCLDWRHSDLENFFDQKWLDYLDRSTKDFDDQVTFL
jgi:hypothetical protein